MAGNLVNNNGTTRTYNAANQMVNDGTNTLTYDANDNLTNDGVNSYTWDRANRMLTAPNSTSYKYDGLSNRIQRTVSSVVTDYLNDVQPGLVKLLRQDDGSNVDHFVHAPRGIHAVDDGTDWTWFTQDGLGSVRGLVDDAADVVSSQSYNPYGVPDGAYGAGYGYAGEVIDGNGLSYNRARYYSPEFGTWMSLDPAETPNRYGYVSGNPVNMIDPLGLFDKSSCQVTAGDYLERIAVRDVGVRLESTGQYIDRNETSPAKRREAWEILYRYNQHIPNPHQIVPGMHIYTPPPENNREGVACSGFTSSIGVAIPCPPDTLNPPEIRPIIDNLPPGTGVCKVEVAGYDLISAFQVGVPGTNIQSGAIGGFAHAFIIFTDAQGEYIFRGGPSDGISASPQYNPTRQEYYDLTNWRGSQPVHSYVRGGGDRFDIDVLDYRLYNSSVRDPGTIRHIPRRTLATGLSVCSAKRCMEEVACKINENYHEYTFFPGPNSNSFARSLLQHCGLPVEEPVTGYSFPGWEMLLSQSQNTSKCTP